MSSRRSAGNTACNICATALLCTASGVSAQTVYKLVDDAGRITYTDQPDTTLSPQSTVSAADVRSALAGNSAISSRPAATINANEAARRLGQAQLLRDRGTAPLPGERVKGAGPGAVNDRYWRRQEKLRLAVEDAQRRVDETHRPRLVRH